MVEILEDIVYDSNNTVVMYYLSPTEPVIIFFFPLAP